MCLTDAVFVAVAVDAATFVSVIVIHSCLVFEEPVVDDYGLRPDPKTFLRDFARQPCRSTELNVARQRRYDWLGQCLYHAVGQVEVHTEPAEYGQAVAATPVEP